MKNKEIEELLNNLKEILENPTTTDECYDGRIIEIDRSYDLELDETKLLLSYIEQLEKDNQCKYRNCCNDIYECSYAEYEDMCNKNMEMALKLEQLENNRDKAIEILNELSNLYDDNYTVSDKAKDIIYKLKGDSDE